MTTKAFLVNSSVIAVSLLVTLLLGEFIVRAVLNPADYLSVELVGDDILGAVIPASAIPGRFDRWGYRNREVPAAADIVAIGDSHTYGNTATMDESWPYVLGRLEGKRVYNLALGGYGPNQYYHLFVSKALELNPRTVVVGLYMGDDFENAFLITYGLKHWSYLRVLPEGQAADFNIWAAAPSPTWDKRIRVWLSQHSVLYQFVFHGPVLAGLLGEWQIRQAHDLSPQATSISVPSRHILEAFRPTIIERNLDQSSELVREGMRITFKLLAEMNTTCREKGIRFLVAVIPTKESVFAEFLEHNPAIPLNEVVDKVIANERQAREQMFAFFKSSNIEFVDLLPALKQSVDGQLYVRSAADMHPNRNGYRVIGEAVSRSLGTVK